MSAYAKHVEYRFNICGERIALRVINENYCDVEEVLKNGQEDTHMSGSLIKTSKGTFEWEDEWESFSEYHSKELADGILGYVNNNGLPSE